MAMANLDSLIKNSTMFSLTKSTSKKLEISSVYNCTKQRILKEFMWPQGALLMRVPSSDVILEAIFHEIAECVYPYKFEPIRYNFHLVQ